MTNTTPVDVLVTDRQRAFARKHQIEVTGALLRRGAEMLGVTPLQKMLFICGTPKDEAGDSYRPSEAALRWRSARQQARRLSYNEAGPGALGPHSTAIEVDTEFARQMERRFRHAGISNLHGFSLCFLWGLIASTLPIKDLRERVFGEDIYLAGRTRYPRFPLSLATENANAFEDERAWFGQANGQNLNPVPRYRCGTCRHYVKMDNGRVCKLYYDNVGLPEAPAFPEDAPACTQHEIRYGPSPVE